MTGSVCVQYSNLKPENWKLLLRIGCEGSTPKAHHGPISVSFLFFFFQIVGRIGLRFFFRIKWLDDDGLSIR